MIYTIDYLAKVIKKDIPALSTSAKNIIKKAIEERLTTDPIAYGKPLRRGLSGQRRLRVSNYRIVYIVDSKTYTVTITTIGHRSTVYD